MRVEWLPEAAHNLTDQAGTRELVVLGTPYVVVYRIEAAAVVILRILHGAQQWPPRS